jgi:glycosyltransferase involved in cell wall biosynthesis
MVWAESNPSTMEKNHLVLNGLARNSVLVSVLGFGMSPENRDYFNKAFAKNALYTLDFGSDQLMFQGKNFLTKQINNFILACHFFSLLYRKIKELKFSVIILPGQPFELVLPSLIAGKIFGVRIVPHVMEFYPSLPSYKKNNNILYRWSWYLIRHCSREYIVISSFLEQKLQVKYDKRIFKLPAILPEIEEKKVDLSNLDFLVGINSPIFIYTSSNAYDDLLDFCLRSLAEISDRQFLLVITGKYSEATQAIWTQLLQKYGLEDKVIFSGFLTDNELASLQIQSVALLIPLLNNDRHRARFPQKVLGYMCLEKPVVTTAVGEMLEYFSNNETVVMDNSVSPKGFSEKIKWLLDNPLSIKNLSTKGKSYVKKTFNSVALGAELKEFLFTNKL